MAVAAVAELVRDDGQHLGRRRRLDERVVEDDPPRGAEPGDVRVQLGRALARVRDEHLAHRHPRIDREPHDGGAQLRVLERTELVEDGLEEDGRDEAEQEDEQSCPDRGDHRPGGGEEHGGAHEPGHTGAGQHRTDPDALDAIDGVLPPGLARETEVALVREPEPDRERKPNECREDDEQRTEHQSAERLGQRVDDRRERLSRPGQRDEGEQSQPDREVGEDGAVARIVVAAGGVPIGHGTGL